MLRIQARGSEYSDNRSLFCQGREGNRIVTHALDLYRSVLWRAWLQSWWSALTGRSHLLLSLSQPGAVGVVRGTYSVGICAVPIRQILGSENRSEDFADFRPRQTQTRARWLSIATACLMGVTMPAVELLQVHDVYYVRDGHHRISVARALKQEYIEAEVMVWEPGAEPRCARPAPVPAPARRRAALQQVKTGSVPGRRVFRRACPHREVLKW